MRAPSIWTRRTILALPWLMVACLTEAEPGDLVEVSADMDGQPDSTADGTGGAFDPQADLVPTEVLDPYRSLIVTEVQILDERFGFARLMDRLADDLGTTREALFRQWWDTQNDQAHAVGDGAHCDDAVDEAGRAVVNGFPIACPRQEGILADRDPFAGEADRFRPTALVNRFDTAPPDGRHCGSYRIVFGKSSALGAVHDRHDRLTVIFEPVLPNPDPARGLEACRPAADFWAELSAIDDLEERARRLAVFFFEGIDGFPPAVRAAHMVAGTGQIRTNQFTPVRPYADGDPLFQFWQLREFQISDGGIVQVSVQQNPFGELFDDRSARPRAAAFQAAFLDALPSLMGDEVAAMTLELPERFYAGQSPSQQEENDYPFHFRNGSGAFRDALQQELDARGSSLTPTQVVRRAMGASCAGCHMLSTQPPFNNLGDDLVWPQSLGFVHISDRERVACPNPDDGLCSQISPALTDVFLPYRQRRLQELLAAGD